MSEHTTESDAPIVTHSIKGHFCGQEQPHAAHTWQTPIRFGSMSIPTYRQCAGLTRVIAPADGSAGAGS